MVKVSQERVDKVSTMKLLLSLAVVVALAIYSIGSFIDSVTVDVETVRAAHVIALVQ